MPGKVIHIDDASHRKLKQLAKAQGRRMRDLAADLIEQAVRDATTSAPPSETSGKRWPPK